MKYLNNLNEIIPKYYYPRFQYRASLIFILLFYLSTIILFIYTLISQILPSPQDGSITYNKMYLDPLSFFVVFIFFTIILFINYGLVFYTYLRVDKEHLIYRNLFYVIKTDWQNIINIDNRIFGIPQWSLSERDYNEYLILSDSKTKSWNRPLTWLVNHTVLSIHIPISLFTSNWRSSELGSIIFTKAEKLKYNLREKKTPWNF